MTNWLLRRDELHRKIYFVTLIGIAVSLLLSRFTLTVFQIVLVVNAILEGNFKEKLHRLKQNKAWIFSSIILLTLIGLWNTESQNITLGLSQIRLRLPFITIPLVVGASQPLSRREGLRIMQFFIAACFLSTLFSLLIYLNMLKNNLNNYRGLSFFIFHIYFSLFILFSIYLIYAYWHEVRLTRKGKVMLILLALWFFFFLLIMKAFTAFIALAAVFVFLFYGVLRDSKKARIPILLIFVVWIGIGTYIGLRLKKDFTAKPIDITLLDKNTQSGNPYYHQENPTQIENGHYLYIYLCEKELQETWDKVSDIPYHRLDKRDQKIKLTLMRYLTSKGIRKDREGVLSLSKKDIRNIENGHANYLYANPISFYSRIHAVYWGMDEYLKTRDPNNKTLSMRFEAWKTGIDIIKNNFWWGVGSGDLKDGFRQQYVDNKSLMNNKSVLGHNTFINVFAQFGIFGFIWFLFAFFYPIFVNQGWKNQVFNVFFIITMVSFISNNGLWHQTEITFTLFFYSLLLFGIAKEKDDKTLKIERE